MSDGFRVVDGHSVTNLYKGMQCPRCRRVAKVQDEPEHDCNVTGLFTPFQMKVVQRYAEVKSRKQGWIVAGGCLGGLVGSLVTSLLLHLTH